MVFLVQFLNKVLKSQIPNYYQYIKESNVRKILSKANKQRKEIGRPFNFDAETENLIITEIRSQRKKHEFMTLSQIIKYV